MLSFAEVGETFVDSVVLRQCIFLIDIYIPYTSVFNAYSFKNNFVVTDAFIFYKGSCLWWMTKHRFSFFLIQEKFMQNWVLHWFFCSLSNSEWSPPHVRSKIEIYRNQPRSIVDYEPGFSSIAFQESKVVCKQIFFNKKKTKQFICVLNSSFCLYWIVRMQTFNEEEVATLYLLTLSLFMAWISICKTEFQNALIEFSLSLLS